MSRGWRIGLFSFIGGLCLSQGAAHEWWRLTVFGLLLLSIALGLVVSGPRASRKIREHGQAIIGAAVIARIFRGVFR